MTPTTEKRCEQSVIELINSRGIDSLLQAIETYLETAGNIQHSHIPRTRRETCAEKIKLTHCVADAWPQF